ncbi:MAG: alpha/beta hydrolase [Dermatophilaceae bacterium]
MSEAEISAPNRQGWRAVVGKVAVAVVRGSLLISPRPMAHLLRREFARSGAERANRLRPAAPDQIHVVTDERYEAHPDSLLDVYVPSDAPVSGRQLPVLVWVHGGAFIGGSKEELDYYFRAVAANGFCVVALKYSLAPGARYPQPVRQSMAALSYVQAHAARLHADSTRIMLAGDSAGSHIVAQLATAITNPDYAREVGVTAAIGAADLRAVALCCGIYDFVAAATDPSMMRLMQALGWAYSGRRDFLRDEYFVSTTAVADHLTVGFPPTFMTVGNVDPLRTQTEGMFRALQSAGVAVETLFYSADHEPPLSHEYQFDLSLDDALIAFERLIAFLNRHSHI